MDRETLVVAAGETGAIVTIEDHFVHGGLGGIVAEALAEERPTPIAFVGMRDRYGTSGTSDEVLRYFNLTPEAIARAAKSVIARKQQ
jgi:transketolase